MGIEGFFGIKGKLVTFFKCFYKLSMTLTTITFSTLNKSNSSAVYGFI